MNQTFNLDEARQRKDRGIGCRGILELELENVENVESILIVTLDKQGKVTVSYSRNSSLEVLGMLQVGTDIILNEMQS